MKCELRLLAKDAKDFRRHMTWRDVFGMILLTTVLWLVAFFISYLLIVPIIIYGFLYSYLEYHDQCT